MSEEDEGAESSPFNETELIEAETIPSPDGEGLSPRHRRLAELLAAGWTNKQIKAELGYSDSRISILRHSPAIQAYLKTLLDRVFEEGVGNRLKRLNEPALNVIEQIVTDRTNRVPIKDKAEMAKWIVEKTDGKAVQKHEVSGGLLLGVMDKLDALDRAGKGMRDLPGAIDVTPGLPPPPNSPRAALSGAQTEPERELTPDEKDELEMLKRWKDGF